MVDSALASFLVVTAEQAMNDARRVEREIVDGRYLGPLHGVPFGLKDVYDTAGVATTGNSAAFRDRVPERDAEAVARLRAAGAILLGKQATHELTYGGVSAELPWPPPRNPWDLDRDTGGSSSGSGAAVAAGISMFALGTDTGGSVRNPAAHCGIVGLKPTFELVSRAGVMLNSFSLDHCGPLARTARDCALVMGAIAGAEPSHAAAPANTGGVPFAPDLERGVVGLRVGVVSHLYERDLPASGEVREAMAAALRLLEHLGARMKEIAIGSLEHYAAVKATIQKPEIYTEYEQDLITRPETFGRKFRARVTGGREVSALSYLRAQRERSRLTAELVKQFDSVDVLVTAGPYGPAPLLADVAASCTFDQPEITVPFSLTRVPALCLCIGFTEAKMPLAMQVAGPPGGDALVLQVAHAYQGATTWHSRHPCL
jgi:aspartyl-tRNA(Asn)/glutamyl-tRNA(Gln) amidotransferase subunit A